MVGARFDRTVLHIGPGKYRPHDRGHVTYGIWRELASGFRDYHVVGRSIGQSAQWSDGNLHVTLLPSHADREVEFLLTQFKAVPIGRRIKPDVIVCQSPALGGLAAAIIARITGARTLMELHGMEYFLPARIGSRFWWLQQLTRLGLGAADRIRVVAPSMAGALPRQYGTAAANRARVLPPRVNTSRFSGRQRRRRAGEPLRVVMVGAVNENKGQRRLIRALENAPFTVELHIVGGGPDLAAVKIVAKTMAVRKSNLQIIAHGPLPHAAVADALRDCDVFVFYSAMESAGRAMMEAMAVGLPAITTNAGFCIDFVEDGREGFVLGADPDREIIEVLDRFWEDPGLAERMGAAARERARRDYDSVRLFEEYRRLIEETARQ
jgi:glycosyltransferase involved in cell wall biosynthesis